MNESKVRESLKNRIMKSESNWINETNELNKMLNQGIKSIQMNLDNGNIKSVDDKVINFVAFKLIDQYY